MTTLDKETAPRARPPDAAPNGKGSGSLPQGEAECKAAVLCDVNLPEVCEGCDYTALMGVQVVCGAGLTPTYCETEAARDLPDREPRR